MDLSQLIVLALVQGFAELLPVSSSAHVIVAEKLMGLDPTAPAMTLLLVMLHTGTMFAVVVYFWRAWKGTYFSSVHGFLVAARGLLVATAATGMVGLGVLAVIKHVVGGAAAGFEVEDLFGNARLMAAALAAAGVLIIVSAQLRERPHAAQTSIRQAIWIGAVQGLCLPFRGFSRSGATISTAMVLGVARRRAEEFSFALAVVLTPAVIVREVYRLLHHQGIAATAGTHALRDAILPSLLGMGLSFVAGLLALRWLTRWLEQGRWLFFGVYCLLAALVVLWVG